MKQLRAFVDSDLFHYDVFGVPRADIVRVAGGDVTDVQRGCRFIFAG
jgi:hypothetical protein